MIKKITNWFNAPAQIYVACKMTGLDCHDMRVIADEVTKKLEAYGHTVHHPIIKENIPYSHTKLKDRTPEEMDRLWNEDCKAVKWATVIFDTAAEVYSTGAKREYGKARYRDWSALVTLWGKDSLPPFIARKEDDVCVHSVEEAAAEIHKRWGTRVKRMAWRLPFYIRHWHNISLYKIWRFFR
jgi:hypothetical protein